MRKFYHIFVNEGNMIRYNGQQFGTLAEVQACFPDGAILEDRPEDWTTSQVVNDSLKRAPEPVLALRKSAVQKIVNEYKAGIAKRKEEKK